MDRNTLIRWVIIAVAGLAFYRFVWPALTGNRAETHQAIPAETYVNAPDFTPDRFDPMGPDQKEPYAPAEGQVCKIRGNRFDAELSSRGAAITHFKLRDAQY